MAVRSIACLVASTFVAALFTGCAPSVESQLVGEWKPEAEMPMMTDVRLNMAADHRFEVTLTSLLGTKTVAGDWEYLRPEGEAHLLSIRPDGASSFDERTFTMPTSDSLVINLDPLGGVRLVRVVEGR
jgi:hypothetical protein